MTRRKSVLLPLFILLVILGGWLGGATVVRADHNDNDFNVAGICYSCHVLNTLLADPDTSFIRASTRTLDQMTAQSGGVAPAVFGCTFCHNDPTRTTYMQSAFSSFEARASQHPVDRGYSRDLFTNVTLAANSYTTLYMSNWDNSWAKPSDQLDCIGCHEMAGSYPNHPRPDNVLRVNNPYMLRGGNSSWSPADNHASNAFCLQVCHAGSAPGTSGYKMGHFGWGAYDNTTGGMPDNTLKEVNGVALKTSKCVDCHETHSANTKPNLMGEQRQSIQSIEAANCTAACHNNADFVAAGHGKPGINYTCANCHNAAVSHRDQSNPKRFSGTEAASKATLAQNFAANGRDDDFDGVIDDPDEATFQYSGESICSTLCHSDKHVHQGEIGGTSGSASCLNCHDVHGHGVDNNAMMIRRTIMGKTTYFFAAGSDYVRSDNNSICDNPGCHAKPLGNTATTGTILGDVQEHIDVNAGPGTNCGSCHSHSSGTGGSSFAPVCNSCHTYPGQTVLGGTHVLSGAHDKHIAQDNVGGYAFACSTCHYRYNHNQSNVQNASQWTSNFQAANVNIKFDGNWNPKNGNGPLYAGAAADNTLSDNVYAPGVGGTGTCAGLYCHGNNPTVASWPAGSNTTPAWNDNATGACGTCHLATASNPPQTFAHRTHADNNLAVGYAISCRKCHYQTTSTGTTITARGGHLNRQSRVSFDATDPLVSSGVYGGTLTVGDSGGTTGNCTNIYCHSPGSRKAPAFDNGAAGAPDWKQAGPLACNACHESPPSYASGSPKANTHPKHAAAPAAFSCQVCHFATTNADNTIASRAKHVNGEWDAVSEGDPVANPGATPRQQSHVFAYDNVARTCNTAACHGGTAPVWGAAGPIACDVCHRNVAGAPAAADADDFFWDNGAMSKIRDSEWTTSGHGRTAGSYNSGRSAPGSGGTSSFPSCTTHCHTSGVSHNAATNPFRLTDKTTPTPITDFSDGVDPQNDNKVCLDCHSATGASPSGSTLHVEQNHYGLKHGAQTLGGSFCWDCHDPHGDANDSMVQDNVTRVSDGVFGVPSSAGGSRAPATFGKTNLNGESYNTVYDWGDYVDNNTPVTGICQVCHIDPPGASGGTTGGAQYFSSTRFTATHNKLAGVQGDRCTTCHFHPKDFTPFCSYCHGNRGDIRWPDNTAEGAAYPDRAGAHQKHINAIGTGNNSCTTCHPGNPPANHVLDTTSGTSQAEVNRMDTDNDNVPNFWTTSFFKTITGATDNNGFYRTADRTCSNLACHSGTTTPRWYYTSDNNPPSWTPDSGITATNVAMGGMVRIDWRRAVDAHPSNPVRYDLYTSTDNSAARVFAADNLVLSDILDNTAVISGLTDNTTYYFGVRAKDNWVPANVTTNTDISAGAIPTEAPPGAINRTYYLQRSSGATLWQSTATTLSATCGTAVNLDVGGATSPPPPGRGLLATGYSCGTASTNNYMETPTGLTASWRYFIGFYLPAYAVTTKVTGSAAGSSFGIQPSWAGGTEQVSVRLAAVDNAGVHTFSTNSVAIPLVSSSMTLYQPDLRSLSIVVPPGQRLALIFQFYFYLQPYALHRVAYDRYDPTILNSVGVTEQSYDNVAPNWVGGVSGIAVTDPGTGGRLNISWNAAVDNNVLPNTPPVLYDLFRSETAPNLWSNLYKEGLGVTSFQDSGLVNGKTYYYGVRAKDSYAPPNKTANTDNASGVPTLSGQYFDCTGCHGTPPTGPENGGSHAAHVSSARVAAGDYTDCDKCHPGATGYTLGHQTGTGKLGFAGTAFQAWYDNIVSGSVWYYDNVNGRYIYQDDTGYGTLTGSKGDNTDNGTCYNTNCHGNPPSPPVWGSSSSVKCWYCHNPGNSYGANPLPPNVNDNSSLGAVTPHVSSRRGTTAADRCRDCHSGHTGGVIVPLPPATWNNNNGGSGLNMRDILGFGGYVSSGGINLGGPGTDCAIALKTTEAEICWACHDLPANAVSEWGFNTKTTPSGFPVVWNTFPTQNDGTAENFNFGWIFADNSCTTKISDWTAGFWSDQYDNAIKRRITSVHTASFDFNGQSSSVSNNVGSGGIVNRSSPVLENKSYIRCSYCHDVHDLNRAQNDDAAGKPFLRGNWVGNPYPPELPPRNSYTYTTKINTDVNFPTPRALSTSRDRGGYFIDQNSGWPTNNPAMDNLAETAGLCTLCHGRSVDTMKFYTGASLWRADMVNGHSNSTLGGTGANKRDIFSGMRPGNWYIANRGMGMQTNVGSCGYACDFYYGSQNQGCDGNYPLAGMFGYNYCYDSHPMIVNTGWYGGSVGTYTGRGGDYDNWYGSGTIGASPPLATAHKFTCSKCHSPHATGLPALLTHNCIDPAQGNFTINGYSGANLLANNCHRKTATTDGWHRLAPGQ